MLPSILTQLDQLCLAQELNNKLFGGKLDLGLVRISLTTPSASLEESYERLELLGNKLPSKWDDECWLIKINDLQETPS